MQSEDQARLLFGGVSVCFFFFFPTFFIFLRGGGPLADGDSNKAEVFYLLTCCREVLLSAILYIQLSGLLWCKTILGECKIMRGFPKILRRQKVDSIRVYCFSFGDRIFILALVLRVAFSYIKLFSVLWWRLQATIFLFSASDFFPFLEDDIWGCLSCWGHKRWRVLTAGRFWTFHFEVNDFDL